MSAVDVYRVGIFDHVHHHGWREGVRREWRFLRTVTAERNWRAVKNSFNGWLAEPTPWPDGLNRCGSGWTRRRAVASLRRQCAKAGQR